MIPREGEKVTLPLRRARPLAVGFERAARGVWRADGSLEREAPGFARFVERIAELAMVLQATELSAVLDDDGLFVAMALPRGVLPMPSVLFRVWDAHIFKQLGHELRALAGLAHELAPGIERSLPVAELPSAVGGGHPMLPWRVWIMLASFGVLVLAALLR